VIGSFFLEKRYILQYYHLLTCYICANVLVKVVVILGVINREPTAIPEHNVFCYSAVAHILTHSVNLAFGPKLGFKNKCRSRAGFGLVISGSGWVQASK